MRRLSQICITFIFFMLLSCSLFLSPRKAYSNSNPQQALPTSKCWGMDLVFLVSQSTMTKVNDPYNLRVEGVRTAVDILGDNALFFCPGYIHRIGVIGFAQPQEKPTSTAFATPKTETYIPLQTKKGSEIVNPTLDLRSNWVDRKNADLKPAIIAKDLGYYSHYGSAFSAAAAQFKAWESDVPDNLPRRRAVIVIGEGGLCTAETSCNNYKKVSSDLNILLDANGSTFPFRGEDNPKTIFISFLGIIARQGDAYNFFDDPYVKNFWNSVAQSHGGVLEILQRGDGDQQEKTMNADLAQKLAGVMNKLLGSRLSSYNCTPIWVEPYYSNVSIFHLFRKTAGTAEDQNKVSILIRGFKGNEEIARYSNGSKLLGSGQVIDYTNPPNEHYVLFQPDPGKYVVEAQGADACKEIDTQYGQSGLTAKVINPEPTASYVEVDQEPYYDKSKDSSFKIQIFQPDAQGQPQPLREIKDYPLEINVEIRNKAGNSEPVTLSLKRSDDVQAIYTSIQPFQTRIPGEYVWKIVGTTRNPREFETSNSIKTPIEILNLQGTFNITSKVQSITLKSDLTDNQKISVVDGEAEKVLQVRLFITNTDNSPLRKDLLLASKTTNLFTAVVKNPDGTITEQKFSADETKNDLFSVDLPASKDRPTHYQSGTYSLTIRLSDNYDKKIFHFDKQEYGPISFTMVPAERITWKLINPQSGVSYPLHPNLGFFTRALPLPLTIKAFNLSGDLIASDTLLSKQNAQLFKGSVVEKGKAREFPLVFLPDKETGTFVADWPAEAEHEGDYVLKVNIDDSVLDSKYLVKDNELVDIDVSRKDTLVSQPWALVALVALIFITALFIVLIINIAIRPIGVVQGLHPKTKALLFEWELGRFLTGWSRINKYRDASLSIFGLKYLKAKKAKPKDSNNGRAVTVEIYDSTGTLSYSDVIDSNETIQFSDDLEITYL